MKREVKYPAIRNDDDLRMAYRLLNCVQEDMLSPVLVRAIKQEVRKWNRMDSATHMVQDNGDSVTLLVELPGHIKNQDVAECYFRNHHYRECLPSAYDCTGQLFTAWYKLFQRNGRWCAYHTICMDV